jgi:hypothetical protein
VHYISGRHHAVEMTSILPTGFNLSNWSKGLEDGEQTHKPNLKTSTQAFNPSMGGGGFNRVKSPQYNTHLGSRHQKRNRPHLISTVTDLLSRTKEKEQMLSPSSENASATLNIAATSSNVSKTVKKNKKPANKKDKKPATKKKKPVKRLSPTSAIKRLQKARMLQLQSSSPAGKKSRTLSKPKKKKNKNTDLN